MLFRSVIIAIALLVSISSNGQSKRIYLHDGWSFRMEGKGSNKGKSFQASVPGSIHQDLFSNKLISDPYYGNNEKTLQWIEEKNWQYESHFQLDSSFFSKQITLVCEGLDTYAEVLLNGESVLFTDNMFRTYNEDVKSILHPGENHIQIRFISPLNYHKKTLKKRAYSLPSGNETVKKQVLSYSRKAAYQFGWDWGPRLVGCGIWRPIYLLISDEARIDHVHVQTIDISDNSATIAYDISIHCYQPEWKELTLSVNGTNYPVNLVNGSNQFHFEEIVNNPKLWYPNGYGEQNMHLASIRLFSKSDTVDQMAVSFGIRQIELVHETDSIGTSFYFKVNGVPFFAKGANYIPRHIFPSATSTLSKEKLIKDIRKANMNMIRVWGGGVYEDDNFYRFCDQNGILVWQDLMFANTLFPNDLNFIENVKDEIRDNVIRLRNHPCIALWCGNNEIEVGWHNWGWQKKYHWTTSDSVEIWQTYQTIFEEIAPAMVERNSPLIPYISTSPLSNWGTPENFNHSSMHYWGVWHGLDDFDGFDKNVGRFMVEYGFQSYPSYDLLKKYIPKDELLLSSSTMLNRQKSYVGNKLILQQIEKRYGKMQDFRKFVICSQYIQTIALRKAITAHRLGSPHCMGTLFWQLNDCWPGPSWSVIDFEGNHKPAYEVVQKLYSPVIAVLDTINQKLTLDAVSDLPDPVTVSIELNIYSMKSTESIMDKKSFYLDLVPLVPQRIYELEFNKISTNDRLEDLVAAVTVQNKNSGQVLFEDQFYFGLSAEEKKLIAN